jgi:hypothetical protein
MGPTPCLAFPVVDAILDVLWARDTVVRGLEIVKGEDVVAILQPTDKSNIPGNVAECFGALKGIVGHRVLRLLVLNAMGRVAQDDEPVIEVGGAKAIASALGLGATGRHVTEVRRALLALRHVVFKLPVIGETALIDLVEEGRTITITVKAPLLASYASTLARARMYLDKRLVPFPSCEAPCAATRYWWAVQSAIQVELLRELRIQAARIAQGGDIHLGRDDFAAFAAKYGMPGGILDQMLAAWSDDTEDQFLTEHDDGTFTISEEYAGVKNMLYESGAMTLSGRQRRQKAIRKRLQVKKAKSTTSDHGLSLVVNNG